MHIEQRHWTSSVGWTVMRRSERAAGAQLVLVFGSSARIREGAFFPSVREWYPQATIISCSTAGEILGTEVFDDTVAVTAIVFEHVSIATVQTTVHAPEESFKVGASLAKQLSKEGLVHAIVFSDGLHVNGTPLVEGLRSALPSNIAVTGGLVGDGADFKHTYVGVNGPATERTVVLIGFYGERLRVGFGSLGGWDVFGPERLITKASNNVLYELDGKPALDLYKEYLGERAAALPSSGLLFPLALHLKNDAGEEEEVVRTLLAVNEAEKSMTFAGDMPEGTYARLMKANFERLLDGASGAAGKSIQPLGQVKPELALLISCIGRKLVLKERTYEELEAVQQAVGSQAKLTGFYSYGEICPTAATEQQCRLHNQTMTVTVFSEVG